MIRDKGNPLTALRTHLGLECEEQVKETQGSYYQRTLEGTRGRQVWVTHTSKEYHLQLTADPRPTAERLFSGPYSHLQVELKCSR